MAKKKKKYRRLLLKDEHGRLRCWCGGLRWAKGRREPGTSDVFHESCFPSKRAAQLHASRMRTAFYSGTSRERLRDEEGRVHRWRDPSDNKVSPVTSVRRGRCSEVAYKTKKKRSRKARKR